MADFDGTLAPIVEDRATAAPLPGAQEVLARLAQRFALTAVVSGRPVSYLQEHLGAVPGLVLIGLYGMERAEDGHTQASAAALAWAPVVSELARRARAEAPAGAEIEEKGLSFALHVRKKPELMEWAANWAARSSAESGLVAQAGKLSIELLPPVGAGKGAVVEQLVAELGLQAACFAGDDIGDLPAFEALSRLRQQGKSTLAIGVASTEEPDRLEKYVDLLVDGPAEALEALRLLAAR
jgi:trehalose 6-phosphate phosphatase